MTIFGVFYNIDGNGQRKIMNVFEFTSSNWDTGTIKWIYILSASYDISDDGRFGSYLQKM